MRPPVQQRRIFPESVVSRGAHAKRALRRPNAWMSLCDRGGASNRPLSSLKSGPRQGYNSRPVRKASIPPSSFSSESFIDNGLR